jgi:4-hydroxy-tetrahydrodipicolinate synthase
VITGIGNVLPRQVLTLVDLSRRAASGDPVAYRHAVELDRAMMPLAELDEGVDLVLYYKHLTTLIGRAGYEHQVHGSDQLSASQRRYAERQLRRFLSWWDAWDARPA